MRPDRRRTTIVDPALQGRMVFAAAWPPCLGMAAGTLLLGIFCRRLQEEALAADADLPSLVPVFLVSISFMVVASVFAVFAAWRLSHKVAGPTHNIGLTLQRYRQGDRSARVRLRKGDYLDGAAEHINTLLDWLAEQPHAGQERTSTALGENDQTADGTVEDPAAAIALAGEAETLEPLAKKP